MTIIIYFFIKESRRDVLNYIILIIMEIVMLTITLYTLSFLFQIFLYEFKEKSVTNASLILFSLLFPLTIVFLYITLDISNYRDLTFYFILILINLLVVKLIKGNKIEFFFFTTVFFSIYLLNLQFKIADIIYMSIFIIVTNLFTVYVRHLIKDFLIIKSLINQGFDSYTKENKKELLRNIMIMKDKNKNRVSIDDIFKLPELSNLSEEKIINKLLDKSYNKVILYYLFYYFIIMGLLTFYFIMSFN